MNRQDIYRLIDVERDRQDELHPLWHGDDHGIVVLAEEFGEVAKALYESKQAMYRPMDFTPYEINRKYKEMCDEIVQTASVCVRWLENRK